MHGQTWHRVRSGKEGGGAEAAFVLAEAIAQFDARAQQPGFRGGNGYSENSGDVGHRNLLHIAQQDHVPQQRRNPVDFLFKHFCHFRFADLGLRGNLPRRQVEDSSVLSRRCVFKIDKAAPALMAEAHEALIHNNSGQPSREARVTLKLTDVLVGFPTSILNFVFGVLTVAKYGSRQFEARGVVPFHQLGKGAVIAFLSESDKDVVIRIMGCLLVLHL